MVADSINSLSGLDTRSVSRERGHYWKVTFPNLSKTASNIKIRTAELTQDEFSHDILIVNIKGSLQGTDRLSAGDPVQLDWGILGESSTWHGYVYMVETATKSSSTITKVICMGLSYFMKNSNQRTFTDVSADKVALKICRENGLKPNIAKHPWTFPMISQTGQSDWNMLVRLATQCGFAFRVDNGVLLFKPKDSIFNETKSYAPYLKYVDEPSSAFIPFMTIYGFHPLIAEQSPDIAGATVQRALSSIERSNNKDYSHSKERKHSAYKTNANKASKFIKEDPKATFKKIVTDEVALSAAHAKQILDAKTEHERFRYKANLQALGNPNLKPYTAVYLDGLPHGMSGYWTVLKVKHMFGGSKSYRVDMSVGTETVGEDYPKTTVDLNTRNINSELLENTIRTAKVTLEDSSYLSKIASVLDPEVKAASTAASKDVEFSTDMYKYLVPDFSESSQVFKWRIT